MTGSSATSSSLHPVSAARRVANIQKLRMHMPARYEATRVFAEDWVIKRGIARGTILAPDYFEAIICAVPPIFRLPFPSSVRRANSVQHAKKDYFSPDVAERGRLFGNIKRNI